MRMIHRAALAALSLLFVAGLAAAQTASQRPTGAASASTAIETMQKQAESQRLRAEIAAKLNQIQGPALAVDARIRAAVAYMQGAAVQMETAQIAARRQLAQCGSMPTLSCQQQAQAELGKVDEAARRAELKANEAAQQAAEVRAGAQSQQAQETMQHMQELMRQIRDKLAAIQQANAEVRRGIPRN